MWPLISPESTLIATHSGLRGRPGAGLSDDAVAGAVTGLAELTRQAGLPPTFGLAHDGRAGGQRLAQLVVDAACRSGVDVLDFGVISTPGAKLAARRRGLGGLVVVTASHLGAEWNGLKLAGGPDLLPIDVGKLPAASARSGGGGVTSEPGAPREHAKAIRASVDGERIGAAGLRVEVSGGADAAGDMLVAALGCAARGAPADLGLRLDADADRLQLIDETGSELDTEVVLPLVAIARQARRIVKGGDTSRIVDIVAAGGGGEVRTVPPGELHLVTELAQGSGDLAGEGNGGVVLPEVGLSRDGLAAGAAILELMARTGKPISQLAAELPRLCRRRSTVDCSSPAEAAEALARVGPATQPHEGVRLERADGAWALARLSATEPVLRLTVEAPVAELADALHDELRSLLAP